MVRYEPRDTNRYIFHLQYIEPYLIFQQVFKQFDIRKKYSNNELSKNNCRIVPPIHLSLCYGEINHFYSLPIQVTTFVEENNYRLEICSELIGH